MACLADKERVASFANEHGTRTSLVGPVGPRTDPLPVHLSCRPSNDGCCPRRRRTRRRRVSVVSFRRTSVDAWCVTRSECDECVWYELQQQDERWSPTHHRHHSSSCADVLRLRFSLDIISRIRLSSVLHR